MNTIQIRIKKIFEIIVLMFFDFSLRILFLNLFEIFQLLFKREHKSNNTQYLIQLVLLPLQVRQYSGHGK